MTKLELPAEEEAIRALRVGDEVLLSGRVVTARDRAHKHMVEDRPGDIRDLLRGAVIYHCGPVMRRKEDGTWEAIAAGPTTSAREEIYQDVVIAEYGIRGVIGKGGMGARTLAALEKHGAVYFHAVGGAAQVLARCVRRVEGVLRLEEFGVPEAFWVFEVEDFPVVVTMDSHGGSLSDQVGARARARLKKIFEGM